MDPMLRWFEYEHLPPELVSVSMNFKIVASYIVDNLPRNPERTVALRKLLEARDAAVRSKIYNDPEGVYARAQSGR